MAELDTTAALTLMMGDTVPRPAMAANAGVPAVAVSYGAHPGERWPRSIRSRWSTTAELAAWLAAQRA